jgi:BirA family transcriptional regulator, biotin operon repressor / biotin---[acetyl-CoA-carboxylase] ligase
LTSVSQKEANIFRLSDTALAQGYRLVVHAEIGSTNDEALACAKAGDPGRLWIAAKAQTRGRGRQGRRWSSPTGNLYASLLLIDAAAQARAPELGFVAGVALARSLRPLIAGDVRLKIKWPNDILFDGAKLAGILLEAQRLEGGRFACIIGIGVNCTAWPRDLPYRTTALDEIVAMPVAPQDVLFALSAEFVHWLEIWSGGAGFEKIRNEWMALAAGIGTPIKVATPTRLIEGVFKTIDSVGRLVLETAAGVIAIEAGDVFFADLPKGTLAGLGD